MWGIGSDSLPSLRMEVEAIVCSDLETEDQAHHLSGDVLLLFYQEIVESIRSARAVRRKKAQTRYFNKSVENAEAIMAAIDDKKTPAIDVPLAQTRHSAVGLSLGGGAHMPLVIKKTVDETCIDRFVDETAIACLLEPHPYTVEYIGTILAGPESLPVIVTGYVSGLPLSHQHAFGLWKEVHEWQLLCALEHLHFSNITHKDVRPENILLSSSGTVCLIDFNLSEVQATRRSPAVVGTKGYAPPEIAVQLVMRQIWKDAMLLGDMVEGTDETWQNIMDTIRMCATETDQKAAAVHFYSVIKDLPDFMRKPTSKIGVRNAQEWQRTMSLSLPPGEPWAWAPALVSAGKWIALSTLSWEIFFLYKNYNGHFGDVFSLARTLEEIRRNQRMHGRDSGLGGSPSPHKTARAERERLIGPEMLEWMKSPDPRRRPTVTEIMTGFIAEGYFRPTV